MKKLLLIAVLAVSFFPASVFAEEDLSRDLKEVIQQREANLQKQVSILEDRIKVQGFNNSQESLLDARLALLEFQRDNSDSLSEKMKYQEKIIELLKQEVAVVKKSMDGGTSTVLELTRAEGAVLNATQNLLKMKIAAEK